MYTLLVLFSYCLPVWLKAVPIITIKVAYLLIALGSMAAFLVQHFTGLLPIPEHALQLFTMFFSGAACYFWRDQLKLSTKWFAIALLLMTAATANKSIFFITYSIFWFYIVLYLAYIPSGHIREFNRLGDYSYGIYIYAWPIQQSIAALTDRISVFQMIILSFGISLTFAIASWHIVEKPSLRMRYKKKNGTPVIKDTLKSQQWNNETI